MDDETIYLREYWLPYIEAHKPLPLQKWTAADIESEAKKLLSYFQKYRGFTKYALQCPTSGAAMEVDLENSMLMLDPGMMITHIDEFASSMERKLVSEYFFDSDLRVFVLNEVRKLTSPDIFEEIWDLAPSGFRDMSSSIFFDHKKGRKTQFPSKLRAGIELVRQHWQFSTLGETVERFIIAGWVPLDYDSCACGFSELDHAKRSYPDFIERVRFILEEARAYLHSKGLAWLDKNAQLREMTGEWQGIIFETTSERDTWRPASGRHVRDIVYDYFAVRAQGHFVLDLSLLRDSKGVIKDAFGHYISELEKKSKYSSEAEEEMGRILPVYHAFSEDDFVAIDSQDKDAVRRINQKSKALRLLVRQSTADSMFANQELEDALHFQEKYLARAQRIRQLKEKALVRVNLPQPVPIFRQIEARPPRFAYPLLNPS